MDLQIGMKVSFKNYDGAKYGKGLIIEDASRIFNTKRYTIQIIEGKMMKNSITTFHRTNYKMLNNRYFYVDKEVLKILHNGRLYPKGSRVQDIRYFDTGTVVTHNTSLRKVYWDKAKVFTLIDVKNLTFIDEPIEIAKRNIKEAMIAYKNYEKDNYIKLQKNTLQYEIPNTEKVEIKLHQKDNRQIRIYIQDTVITAHDNLGNIGIAKCSPDDVFDIKTGITLAMNRLQNSEKGVVINATKQC